MNQDIESAVFRIVRAAGEFLLLTLLIALVPLLVAIDVNVIGHGVGESSVTEIVQETLLAFSATIFGYCAWRKPEMRGFLVLVTGFFACMLIRELDGLLDLIWHGFWFWPAIITAGASIVSTAYFWRDSVIRPMTDFIGTNAYFHILFGLLTVLVFSRIFGSGNLLWKHLLGAGYSGLFRGALQEGLELFGYIFIAYGSSLMLRRKKPLPHR